MRNYPRSPQKFIVQSHWPTPWRTSVWLIASLHCQIPIPTPHGSLKWVQLPFFLNSSPDAVPFHWHMLYSNKTTDHIAVPSLCDWSLYLHNLSKAYAIFCKIFEYWTLSELLLPQIFSEFLLVYPLLIHLNSFCPLLFIFLYLSWLDFQTRCRGVWMNHQLGCTKRQHSNYRPLKCIT